MRFPLFLFASAAFAADVYVVAGQSNGYRISSLRPGATPIPGGHRIYYYGMNCTSEPEYSRYEVITSLDHRAMGTTLALELVKLSNADIVFVQYCRCGSGVWNRTGRGWYPGDDPAAGKVFEAGLFAKFRKFIGHARASAEWDYRLTWNPKALFWHQGENDSNSDHHLAYQRNLTNLFGRFRAELGDSLPIVAGEIRELTDGDRAINRILAAVAKSYPRTALARASGLPFEPDRNGQPNVHFALAGCQELGRRMAAEYRRLAR
jgi:hypothetical protein